MSERILNDYLAALENSKPIPIEKEVELFRQYKNGNQAAGQEILQANLRFVVSVAKEYKQFADLGDLIQEGNIGMIKALERHEIDKGFKFISYAVFWIRQGITQYLNDKTNNVRMPAHRKLLLNRVNKVIEQFEQKNEGLKPTKEELKQYLEPKDIKKLDDLALPVREYSLENPTNDEYRSWIDILKNPDQEELLTNMNNQSLEQSLKLAIKEVLNPREQDIVKQYYGIDCEQKNLQEIGDQYNLSRERIRKIKEVALIKIKRSSHKKELATYTNNVKF
jgi:RNA polymerase primary sigma factor